jgi:hypothetical protein
MNMKAIEICNVAFGKCMYQYMELRIMLWSSGLCHCGFQLLEEHPENHSPDTALYPREPNPKEGLFTTRQTSDTVHHAVQIPRPLHFSTPVWNSLNMVLLELWRWRAQLLLWVNVKVRRILTVKGEKVGILFWEYNRICTLNDWEVPWKPSGC